MVLFVWRVLFFRTVRIPGQDAVGVDGNPTNHQLIESICFSRYLDEWFVNKRAAGADYWKSLNIQPRDMYFGSHTGAFRIFPARQSQTCGVYDPRLRPWYVAGSSGSKNVILILDVSGSMGDKNRLPMLKLAAKRVVSTLTISDRVLIVPFSTNAQPITTQDGYMFRATNDNKAYFSNAIDQFSAQGNTNFYDAFGKAFDVFEKSAAHEITASCNSAILFFTGTPHSAIVKSFPLSTTNI